MIGGCGRTDFQGGDAGQLHDSITQRLFRSPTRRWSGPGHDYKGARVVRIGRKRATLRLGGSAARSSSDDVQPRPRPPERLMAKPSRPTCAAAAKARTCREPHEPDPARPTASWAAKTASPADAPLLTLMDTLPEAWDVPQMHPEDLSGSGSSPRSFRLAGGPPLYEQEFGHPRLRARHLLFQHRQRRT